MAVYKRLALISLALWVASTVISAFVTAMNDTRRADLDAVLTDLDALKGRPRVVLVGSSNVLLGLSAGQLAQVAGVPALNAGTAGGRPRFNDYFRIVVDRIRPGDVVVVSPPVSVVVDVGSQPYGCKDPSSFECVASKWRPAPQLLQFIKPPASLYQWPSQRTDKGDVVFDGRAPSPSAAKMPKPMFSRNSVDIVAQQIEMIRARGACPVIAFPPKLVLDEAKAEWDEEFGRAVAAFKAAGLDGALVGSMMVQTNRGYFMNDIDHPSAVGRDAWTRMVVKDLQEHRRCGMAWGAKRQG